MSTSPKQKVYQGVLEEIRHFIAKNNLKTGDKLPSERDLSEKLKAGRTSVREALRAMELLGLIETRYGEGTYLSAYRPYQTVELLASFILRESNTKNDLIFVKKVLEKEAAKLAFSRMDEKDLKVLEDLLLQDTTDANKKHLTFFNYIFDKTENLLLTKVWILMEEFSHTINAIYYNYTFYNELIQLYRSGNYQGIEKLFNSLNGTDVC